VIGALKRHGLIDGAIRAPQPGAPFAYVTTRKFLEAFGLGTLRDLPDIEKFKAEGLTHRGHGEDDLDSALGLAKKNWINWRATTSFGANNAPFLAGNGTSVRIPSGAPSPAYHAVAALILVTDCSPCNHLAA
jgi:hypothetical protein